MAILGIHHTALVVPDLDQALAFYCTVLGFVPVGEPHTTCPAPALATGLAQPEARGCLLKAGWGYLALWEFTDAASAPSQYFWGPVHEPGFRHISVHVDDALAVWKRTACDITWHNRPVGHSVEGDDNDAWTAYGRDPFGNIVEMWKLGHEDPQPFAPDQPSEPGAEAGLLADTSQGILGLHHTAVVVPNLDQGLAFYCGVLGFEEDQDGPIEPSDYAERHTQLPQPKARGRELRTPWGYLEIWEFLHPRWDGPTTAQRPVNQPGFAWCSLLVDDVAAEQARLQEHMTIHPTPAAQQPDPVGGQVVCASDPFGNLYELRQLAADSPQPFAPVGGAG